MINFNVTNLVPVFSNEIDMREGFNYLYSSEFYPLAA